MAIETRSGTGGTTYLQLDFGKKSMYIYNGEEKEGFEKHTTSTGKVSYRQYVNAVSGHITGAYFKDNNFGGTELVLVFTDEGSKFAVQMGVEESVFQVLARSINNIDITQRVRMAIYESKGNNGKSYFGVSLSYPDNVDAEGKAKFVEWGEELPKGKQLRNGKWDFAAVNDEAYGRVEDFIKTSNFEKYDANANGNTSAETATEKPKDNKKAQGSTSDVDDDDLPF